MSFAALALRARAANDTTRAQINNIPSKSHVIPLLRRDTGRNASLDPEIQVGYFPFLVRSSIMHCDFELSRGQRGPFSSLVQVLNAFFF